MKKIIQLLVLLFVQFSFAQQDNVVKYLAENWGVNKDVAKIEEVNYSVGFTSGKFEPRETKIYTFKNGKVISIETQYSKDKVIETFEYNAKGKPVRFSYISTGTDKASENISTFSYDKNGKLIEIKPSNPRFHWQYKYQYKSDGTLASVEIFDNGKLDSTWNFTSYQDEKNYQYIDENYSANDGKKVFELKESLVNGQRPMRKEAWLEGKDPNGNVFKIRENNAVFGKYYFFRKLTYTNGETTGSTEYNPYFTEGINGDIFQLLENKNPKSTYKIRLGEDGKFKMENQANQPIPDLSKGFISPNKTDFIYFDPNNGEVALVEDMKPSEEFVAMKPYNVPSKRYIVINNDYQFIIFDNGKQIDTSSMKLAQDMGNLVIQENGVPKYFVPNLDKLTFLKFYPLYILAL
ncbi:hypothetical protein [Cloacibacterium caeni]|uniref:hypothetical protein n=1 Tax=Cloacibacterium caeni TaxID=2004710 RepID=UPI001BCB25C5|nr:hypothetical protein [Cloacibacterium caeni]